MTYLHREIDRYLEAWKVAKRHKPLLLRGARQVGKSSSIRHLAESFSSFVEVNFERQPQMKDLFDGSLDPKQIVDKLSVLYDTQIKGDETLLFFDEIQECPQAITALRYFWEEMPDLHVIGAGSLLEFALKEISTFGVGRIRSLFMYPLSFCEFLEANGNGLLRRLLEGEEEIAPEIHDKLVEIFRTYLLVGGMPEAVKTWVEDRDLIECSRIHRDIVGNYEVDFAKYSSKINPSLLRATLRSAVRQVASKFVYSRVDSEVKARDVKEALDLLVLAGLLIPVKATAANGLPLGAETKSGFVKYLYLDSGLMLAMLRLNGEDIQSLIEEVTIGSPKDLVNRGPLAEMVAGLEIVKNGETDVPPEMFYWLKEEKGSNAEVDYVLPIKGEIVPVEVKSGVQGGMKSLKLFIESKHSKRALRLSLEPPGELSLSDATVRILPIYAICRLRATVQV